MICPKCGQDDDIVVDSRALRGGISVRRRRVCKKCGYRFTTYEEVDQTERVVVKRDGTRQPFDHMKVERGVRTACRNLPVSDDEIRRLVDGIGKDLEKEGFAVRSSRIGTLIMKRLRVLNEVAYVRFVSVYRRFKSVKEFLAIVTNLSDEEPEEKKE